jgi:maltooligosyltrehalose trehalohydrolase
LRKAVLVPILLEDSFSMASTTATKIPAWRRLPIGVEVNADGAAHARVWAPRRKSVELVTFGSDGVADRIVPLEREHGGFFSGCAPGLRAGNRYRYRLDGGDAFPDPASRYQPEGPHGPSQIIDPTFNWTDAGWRGITPAGQVISEIHIGTFTPEGTFGAATAKLDALVDVGITAIEIMPLADFPGKFGWGYDGVNLYAPTRLYGTPDDLRALVDAAHARGLGVILDVVYNHLGPDGNYLTQYSDRYVGKRPTEWGDSLNFDGEDSAPVREFVVRNAEYWITEFHLDGLRLDATQQIYDDSHRHIIADVVAAARAAAGERHILLIAENEPQDNRLIRTPTDGGFGVDALWNDDFHHAAFVAMTGKAEAYNSDYRGTPQEFVSAVKHGFLYQGQFYSWQKDRRGTPALDFGPTSFVNFLESHDQVANLARSRRLHQLTSPALFRAMTALLLLSPQTPMLFQGAEWIASPRFPFFAGHAGDLARMVREGRATFLTQFPSVAAAGVDLMLPDPASPETFAAAKLDWDERERHPEAVALHRDLIALRKSDPVLSARSDADGRRIDGAVIDTNAFVLRYFAADGLDRLLVVNLGALVRTPSIAEPLLAPLQDRRWRTIWSSEDPKYGGSGTPEIGVRGRGWLISAQSAVFLAPAELDAETPAR